MAPPPVRYVDHTRESGHALCPPAVRMAVVTVYGEGPDPAAYEAYVQPVVALQSFTRKHYWYAARSTDEMPSTSGTERDLLRRGWVLSVVEAVTTALVCDEDFGLVSYDDDPGPNEVFRLVACPWPADEDGERLAPVVARLRGDLEGRLRGPAGPGGGGV
jgi:hypothetical protein